MHKYLLILPMALLLAACSGSDDQNPSPAPAAAPASSATVSTAPAAGRTAPEPASEALPEHASDSTGSAAATSTTDSPPAPPSTAAADAGSATSDDQAEAREPAVAAPVDTGKWVEGKNYFLIQPQQPRLTTSDKIQVVEVFSYGCPACNSAHAFMQKLAKSLPAYAEMDYLPVSFRPDENFPLYQRAFYTAQAFGVARKAHDAMFDAVWKSGELGTYNLKTGRPKPHDDWPDMQDIARFYAQYGVDPAQFVATSQSFAINTKMKRADQLIKNWQVNSTPTVVIDGKYRYTANSAGGYQQMLEMTDWLVQKERHAMQSTR